MADSSPTCRVVRASGAATGKQALTYAAGISAETAGARGLNLHVTIPPGGQAKPHLHENHESALYVLSGEAVMWFGDHLAEHVSVGPGDFLFVPPNIPHQPYNRSATEPRIAVVARTDPNEQESVVLLPRLDGLHRDSAC
jgi:uncharacterized RmlC-like cupin family protein